MTLRLTVNEAEWVAHVQRVDHAFPGLVPVVKGNGYGFRRWNLMTLAGQLANEVCVGSVYELKEVPATVTPIVLTPTLTSPPKAMPESAILTVGSVHHVVALESTGWKGRVMVKLQSATRRYGVEPNGLADLHSAIADAGMTIHGYAIHPPLAGDQRSHIVEIETWLESLPADLPVYVSHLEARAYGALCKDNRTRTFRIRLGTVLWHGDKSMMQLSADVIDRHPVEPGERAGYRQVPIAGPGELLMVGAGTSHGVRVHEDGRSPFHFQRQRLNMLEPPHMHTSMLYIARGRPAPSIGEWLDVQRPLTQVNVDLLQWIR